MIASQLRQLLHSNNCTPDVLTIDLFALEMTELGWRDAKVDCPREKGVYIHVSEHGLPLRVGIAMGQEGIYGRWFHSRTSHLYSFQQRREQADNYRCFFDQIRQNYHQTYVLYLLLDEQWARTTERVLMTTLLPLWEVRNIAGKYIWRDLDFWRKNPTSLEKSEQLRAYQVQKKWMLL